MREPDVLARELLGSNPDAIEPLVIWTDRGTHRVTIGSERFVVKTDDDLETVAREAAGQLRAAAAGVPVPEVVATVADAFAMRWVDGPTLTEHPAPDAWHDTGARIRIAHELGGEPPFGTGFGGFEAEQPTWRRFFCAFAESMLRDCERELDFPFAAAARIREALDRAASLLDTPRLGWCHGDFQPDHVVVDAATNRVAAIIDWADQGSGDVGWDVAVLTIDHHEHRDAFYDGYGASASLQAALDRLLPLYEVVRLLGSAGWLAEHHHPLAAEHRQRAIDWRA